MTLAETIFDVYWFQTVVKVLIVAVLIPTTALILGIVFLFKVMSWMQSRLGPQEAGPKGLFQLIADGVKFLQKEDLTPVNADVRVFRMAPIVVLISTFLLFVIIPASPNIVVENLPNGVFFAFAVSSISVIGILMAGWASANKYALLGGIRAAGQLIAYELPMVLAVVGVVMQAGTLSMNGIVVQQSQFELFGTIPVPYIVTQLPMFLVFLAATQAELTQTPFDMPVAESELIAGYQVEYSGFRFLFFFMGEFATAFAFAAIASVLFLGGYAFPFVDIYQANGEVNNIYWVLGPIVLFAKIMFVSFLIFWFRFTYPRFREDQLQRLAWKWLIPISLVWISVTALFKVAWTG